jgi:outer membrane protein assembly factor BamB
VNFQKIVRANHAISKTFAVIIIVALIAVSVVGGVFVLSRSSSPATSTLETNSPSYPLTIENNIPYPGNSTEIFETTQYATYQPILGLGNGVLQFEGNNNHVYNYSWSGALASFNTTVGSSIIVPPTLYNGLLLVDLSGNTTFGGIAAINVQNGQMVWKTTVPNMVMSQPITYNSLAIVGLGTNAFRNTTTTIRGAGVNFVAALNCSTGQVVWTFSTVGEDMPTPLIYSGLVVWGNGNGEVYALNATSGVEVWSASLVSGSFVSMSSPALLGDSIYFGANNPYGFYCVNLTDGQISWSTMLPAHGGLDDCSPVISNDIVISGYTVNVSYVMLQPVLFAMNTTNGNILWQFNEMSGAIPPAIQVPPLTVWNGIVYSDPTEGGTLYAVNATSGSFLWSFNTGGDNSNVNIFNDSLYIVNSAGTLFALEPTSGALLNETNVGGGLGPGNLIFAGQNVIICEQSGQVISMPVSSIFPSS